MRKYHLYFRFVFEYEMNLKFKINKEGINTIKNHFAIEKLYEKWSSKVPIGGLVRNRRILSLKLKKKY